MVPPSYTFVPLSPSPRCIWANQLCVLRASMSSCWVAGTETASSARPSPISTPFLLRTPWTWCSERERESKKHKEEKGNNANGGKRLRLCILATVGRCGGGAAQQRQMRRESGLLAFCICTLFGWTGLRHRWFGLLSHQTPMPALDEVTVGATFHSGWWRVQSA